MRGRGARDVISRPRHTAPAPPSSLISQLASLSAAMTGPIGLRGHRTCHNREPPRRSHVSLDGIDTIVSAIDVRHSVTGSDMGSLPPHGKPPWAALSRVYVGSPVRSAMGKEIKTQGSVGMPAPSAVRGKTLHQEELHCNNIKKDAVPHTPLPTKQQVPACKEGGEEG